MSELQAELSEEQLQAIERERALRINEGLKGSDLHRGMVETSGPRSTPFRISPEPVYIDRRLYEELVALGPHLRAFYEAANRLYLQSVRGSQPGWVREYLDRGKSETVVDYQRMRRFRTALPAIIRPDVIPTEDGIVISELDSVPGGFGLLAAISREYAELGFDLVGGADGIAQGFWEAIRSLVPQVADPVCAIVVSDESDAYRGEMEWLSRHLASEGKRIYTAHPRQLLYTEEGVYVPDPEGECELFGTACRRVDVVYRFFELFDLKNIPKIDLLLYAVRKELVQMTPPIKSHLEEKLLMALLHHGALGSFWQDQMGHRSYEVCRRVFPESWIVDPRPLPPHAVIPGLEMGGRPVSDWRQLKSARQRERELVLKPSGYSPEAWGSRGVMIGHDLPAEEWAEGIEKALASFETTPYVLQRFHKGRRFEVKYFDFDEGRVKSMGARLRLCPYYFCVGEETKLGGVLATACSLEKKVIHGMADAVMAPVAVAEG